MTNATGELSDWQNRIIGYDTKPADQFTANPRNPRRHPQRQREAVRGSLNELGWVGVAIENVRTGNLLDGHERVWQALQNGNADVPYIAVDLTEEEEALFLAAFDYTTGMAEYDREMLDGLMRDIQTGEAGLQAMLAEMAEAEGIIPPDFQPVPMDEQPRLDQKAPITCPYCGEEFVP